MLRLALENTLSSHRCGYRHICKAGRTSFSPTEPVQCPLRKPWHVCIGTARKAFICELVGTYQHNEHQHQELFSRVEFPARLILHDQAFRNLQQRVLHLMRRNTKECATSRVSQYSKE